MQRYVKKISFIVTLIIITSISCHVETDGNPSDSLPKAILIDFIFENKTQTPVTVRIRHKYQWQWKKNLDTIANTAYTEWIEDVIEAGENKPIGVEKVELSNKTSTWEETGFILLDWYTGAISMGTGNFYSSAEVEIETENNVIIIQDAALYDIKNLKPKLVCLFIDYPFKTSILFTCKQGMEIRKIFKLPVKLTMKQDDTLTIEHETLTSGSGIHVYSDGDTGGIVGYNMGTITNCDNNALVCYSYSDNRFSKIHSISGIAGINYYSISNVTDKAMILYGGYSKLCASFADVKRLKTKRY